MLMHTLIRMLSMVRPRFDEFHKIWETQLPAQQLIMNRFCINFRLFRLCVCVRERERVRERHGDVEREEYGIGCIFNQRELAFPCRRDKEGGNGRRWVGE